MRQSKSGCLFLLMGKNHKLESLMNGMGLFIIIAAETIVKEQLIYVVLPLRSG